MKWKEVLCNTNSIWDEFHYIFQCKALDKERSTYINMKFLGCSNVLVMERLFNSEDHMTLSKLAMFCIIMGKYYANCGQNNSQGTNTQGSLSCKIKNAKTKDTKQKTLKVEQQEKRHPMSENCLCVGTLPEHVRKEYSYSTLLDNYFRDLVISQHILWLCM